MPRSLRVLVPLLLAVAAVVLLCSAGLAVPYSRNKRILADEALSQVVIKDGMPPSPETARPICHQVLRMREGNHHDAFLLLEHCGDRSSVPYLMQALRWHPPGPNGMICTTAHGFEALKAITHRDFGLDLNAWEQWSKEPPR